MTLIDILLGRRLSNREQDTRKIGWFEAVPAMGLDGLGSASYGPEAALTILIPLGTASLAWVGWVMAPIVALLVALYLSYRQTVVAYLTNGGAYMVARENLGRNASLLAAAALMVDYILNVAVASRPGGSSPCRQGAGGRPGPQDAHRHLPHPGPAPRRHRRRGPRLRPRGHGPDETRLPERPLAAGRRDRGAGRRLPRGGCCSSTATSA